MGFNLFGTFIPYYGFFITCGIICAFLLGLFLCKKEKINSDDFLIICSYIAAFGIFGAKLLYIIVSFKSIDFTLVFSSMKNFNLFIGSGFVFYGGLLGGLFALYFTKKVHKINVSEYIKIITPCLGLAHCFGRIGCYMAGCCYGKETAGHIYRIYKNSIIAPNHVRLLPVQLFEAVFVFILALIMLVLLWKKIKINLPLVYLSSYSIFRFIIEFFRGDIERGKLGGLSTSQIISLCLLIGIIIYMFLKDKIDFKTIAGSVEQDSEAVVCSAAKD